MASPLIHDQSVSAPHNSGGHGPEAENEPASATALTSASDVNVAQIVSATGWSPATVRRRARTLGGRRGPDGAWRFPSVVLEKITTTERATFGAGRSAAEPPDVGKRAAAVYRMLEEGRSESEIVRALEESPDVVARMKEAWRRGYESDRRDRPTCVCGAAGDPCVVQCRACFASSMRLSEEQRRLLRGQPIPPAIRCACGAVADEGVCSSCVADISVSLEGDMLLVRAGDRVVKALSAAPIAAQLAPTVASATVGSVAPPTVAEPEAVSTSSDEGTRAIVAEARRVVAEARKPKPIRIEEE